jgi:crotonobetainyl-CoA:carnitine CoA-transferase CaiB-like acyl-CoA transferase
MPLSGTRVIELGTGSALAYCGKLFADFGADVLKLEPPGGDPGRAEPPLVDSGEGHESAYFAWANTNKRSIIVDIATRAGAARAGELIACADVLLDARPPGESSQDALAHDALRAANPRLIIVAISWFGESGPYRNFVATDAVCRALAGLVKLVGPKNGPPLALNDHQADIVGGLTAFIAAMAGLYGRDGLGRRFSISLHEASVQLAEYQAALGVSGNIPLERQGVNRFPPTFPLGVYACREGFIGVTVVTPPQWLAFCDLLGLPALKANPDYLVNLNRCLHADAIESEFAARLLERTAAQWFAGALQLRLPFAIVPTIADLLTQKIHRDRGAFVPVRMGSAELEGPILPLRLAKTPPRSGGVAPRAGAHDGDGPEPRPAAEAQPVLHGPPLRGLRIVDLSMGWAGPLATRHMADLGAEVIKVEACQYPDWWRGFDVRPIFFDERHYEKRPSYLVMNRNKLGVTLDLTSADGVALVKLLVKDADAVIENYSREVLPKLGLDYPALVRDKPDLVMVSMPAFGGGEWADCRAYGSTLEHASGLPMVCGPEGGLPTMSHIAYGDVIGGLNAASALMSALTHRRRTGEGQHVDLSQVECMLPLVASWIIEQSATGTLRPRLGNRHPTYVPHGCFRCAGEDAWVLIAVTDDAAWPRLCEAIGRHDLAADPDLVSAVGRRRRQTELEQALASWTARRGADEAMLVLQNAGVAAGAVRSPFELDREPHLMARRFWQPVERPFVGRHDQPSAPFRERDEPYAVHHPAPTLGEHNEKVLMGLLGLTRPEMERLAARKVIGTQALPRTARKANVAAE